MTIINPLPYNIQNGQSVDAVPVMANLNQIVSNVNANAAPVAGNAAQTFAVANATATNQAVNWAQAGTQIVFSTGTTPIAPVAAYTLVYPNFTAAGALTINPATTAGQRVRVYGGAYAVTVLSNVSSGSPFWLFQMGAQVIRGLFLQALVNSTLKWFGTVVTGVAQRQARSLLHQQVRQIKLLF
jgi:hypothetical protein